MQSSDGTIQNELNKIRSELAAIKDTLDSIRKNIREFVIHLNSDLLIEFASDSFCNALHINLKEIIGKTVFEIGIPEFSANLLNVAFSYYLSKKVRLKPELNIHYRLPE